MHALEKTKTATIGLGYVGLPTAVEFGEQFDTPGFDINAARMEELRAGHGHPLEVDATGQGPSLIQDCMP